MAGRKRLGQEHACKCNSTHKMWAREGSKQNRKAGVEGNSRGQKLLLPLESVAELFRALVEAEFSQRKLCRLLPVSLEQAAESVQSRCVGQGWDLRAGASWDPRAVDSDAGEAVLGQSQY